MVTQPGLLLLLLLVSAGHCSKLTRPYSPTRDAREILGAMSDRFASYNWEILLFSGGPRGWSISTISSSSSTSLPNTSSLLHSRNPTCP